MNFEKVWLNEETLPILLEKYLPKKVKQCRITPHTKLVVMPFVAIDYDRLR